MLAAWLAEGVGVAIAEALSPSSNILDSAETHCKILPYLAGCQLAAKLMPFVVVEHPRRRERSRE